MGVLGCGPSSPLFLASPYMLTHVMQQFGPVSLCTCLLSLVFQLAVHLHAGFYPWFACLHSSEGFFMSSAKHGSLCCDSTLIVVQVLGHEAVLDTEQPQQRTH